MKKIIIGGLLALTLAGGFLGTKAYAISNTTQSNYGTHFFQNKGSFGGMMGGFNRGMMGGYFQNNQGNITEEQRVELQKAREEIRTIMANSSNEMIGIRQELNNAFASKDKNTIISAYEKMVEFHNKKNTELKPIYEKISNILGTTVSNQELSFKNTFMQEKIDALKNASTEAEINAAIAGLQGNHCGFGSPGGFGPKGGRGMMNSFSKFGGCRN